MRKTKTDYEILETCRDHWKNSYRQRDKELRALREDVDRWKAAAHETLSEDQYSKIFSSNAEALGRQERVISDPSWKEWLAAAVS